MKKVKLSSFLILQHFEILFVNSAFLLKLFISTSFASTLKYKRSRASSGHGFKSSPGQHMACLECLFLSDLTFFDRDEKIAAYTIFNFYPTALKGCRGIVFTHGVQSGGRREIVCPGCISETVRCRKFILGRDIGWGV